MNEAQRHRSLLSYLEENTFITTNDYTNMIDISLSTARRDITKLSKEGRLKKIRNGAEVLESDLNASTHTPLSFIPNEKEIEDVDIKERIAEAAVTMCDDHDSVIISGSNTTFLMSKHIIHRDIQVITNFMPFVYQLISQEYKNIIILGGQYIPERHIVISPDTKIIEDYKSRFVFFTGTGLTTAGVHTSDLLVYMAEKKLFEYGDKLVALIDSNKIGKAGGRLLAAAANIDILITDANADSEILASLSDQGVKIVIV